MFDIRVVAVKQFCPKTPSKQFSRYYSYHSNNKWQQIEVCVCVTGKFGTDPIPSEYRASIDDTNTDTFYLHMQLMCFHAGETNINLLE